MSWGQAIPLHPWMKLATDLLHFEGASCLLIVDYTSRFPVAQKCYITFLEVAKIFIEKTEQ